MMTVKQVSALTGVSVRTLQFYDEIGLLKPTEVSSAGYRLYDEGALETLQQILFFKELDFTLKEIKTIMNDPQFDRQAAFEKQRELIEMKRDRLNNLLGLLDRLVKGEKCVEFQEFDLSGYFRMLRKFKNTHAEGIVKQFGSVEQFEKIIRVMEANENQALDAAVELYGSVGEYTAAIEKNLKHYLDNGPPISQQEAAELIEKQEELTKRLTADLTRDPASPQVQQVMGELISFVKESNATMELGKNYWPWLADHYTASPAYIRVNDEKYGTGASEYIGRAIRAYLEQNRKR